MIAHMPILIIISCLLSAFIIPISGRYRNKIAGPLVRFVVISNTVMIAFLLYHVTKYGAFQYFLGDWAPPWGIALTVDALSLFMILVINGLSVLILIYATKELSHDIGPQLEPWYYTLYILLVGALSAISLSNDIFNIFVFTEIATITACGIIAIKPNRDCIEASLKYMILSTLGSGLILLAIALVYMITGHFNLDFIAIQIPLVQGIYPLNVLVSLALFIVGFGIKAALFPLHVWLPDAHSSAPSPSSAVLSGVVVKVYTIVLLRIIFRVYGQELFTAIPIDSIILMMATLAIFAGSLFAIAQDDIKRMLAFSSVAQIGYIFLGIALVSETGIIGGVLHVANHALMKSLLFLSAGAIIYKTGYRKISDLEGIGFIMPLSMTAFSIGALSMVGIPGLNGFISKFYLALGALDAGKPFYAIVIIISSMLNAIYYLPIVLKAFFGGGEHTSFKADGLPISMSIPLVVIGIACLYFGLLPGSLLELVGKVAQMLFASN